MEKSRRCIHLKKIMETFMRISNRFAHFLPIMLFKNKLNIWARYLNFHRLECTCDFQNQIQSFRTCEINDLCRGFLRFCCSSSAIKDDEGRTKQRYDRHRQLDLKSKIICLISWLLFYFMTWIWNKMFHLILFSSEEKNIDFTSNSSPTKTNHVIFWYDFRYGFDFSYIILWWSFLVTVQTQIHSSSFFDDASFSISIMIF